MSRPSRRTASSRLSRPRSRVALWESLAPICSRSSSRCVTRSSSPGRTARRRRAEMIAFCLERLGLDPAWLIGADIPQLGGNAGAGAGWLVVEGDESDRTVAALRPRDRCRHERRPRPSHDLWLACRGRCALRRLAGGGSRSRARRGARAVSTSSSPSPGEHNRRNAATALAALELAGVAALRCASRAGRVSRRRRDGWSCAARRRASRCTTTTRHHPAEIAATVAALRRDKRRVCSCSSSRISFRERDISPASFARALADADVVAVTEIYPAREQPIAGVSGQARGRRARRARGRGCRSAWTPVLDEGGAFLAGGREPGDTVSSRSEPETSTALAAIVLEALR